MKVHHVPLQSTEEDKIFGGIASIRQAIYLAIGGIMAAGWFLLVYSMGWPFFVVLLGTGPLLAGAYLGFGRVEPYGLNVDRYLALRAAALFAEGEYPYRQDCRPE